MHVTIMGMKWIMRRSINEPDADGDGHDEKDGSDVLMMAVTSMKKRTRKTIMRVLISMTMMMLMTAMTIITKQS